MNISPKTVTFDDNNMWVALADGLLVGQGDIIHKPFKAA